MRRGGLLAMLLAAVALAVTDRALARPADQLFPIDLHVVGGEYSWQVEERFRLEWSRPPIADLGLPIAAVGYRVRDAAGAVIVHETRLPGARDRIDVQIPPVPGTYTAEVWLEAGGGERGPAVATTLRYDNRRPGTARISSPAAWISGGSAAVVEIEPPDVAPVSGIHGYAVSIDRGGETWPCGSRGHCGDTEVDLQDSQGGTLALGTLPEGLSVVRAVAVSGAGLPSLQAGSAVVRVDATPPAVTLRGAPPGWSNGPVALVARATDALSGMEADGPNGPFTAIVVDGGVPRIESGDFATTTVAGEGVHRVDVFARDAAGNVDRRLAASAVVPIDESPPQVRFAASQDPREPERIEATVDDALAGADPGRGSIAVREAGSGGPWQPLPTEATAAGLRARWNSDSYPDGIYEFMVTGYDRAGNSASSTGRANHTRMVLVNPLKQQVELRGGLSRHRTGAALPYGRGAVYRGRLSDTNGAPLAGLPVRIVESFRPGASSPQRTTGVLTAADGTFALRLRPGGSRQVEASFGGTRTLRPAETGETSLEVLAGISMRASSRTARIGGAPVVFSGRVGRRDARPPRGGLPVELQFRVPGGTWSEFRTVRTDARGRFRYAYAFSDDDSRGVRFRFRAHTGGGDWPYEPAASKAVSVTGR